MSAPTNTTDNKPLRIRRGRVDSVDLYEVKDSELDLLEKGSPANLQLNFSIFLLSISFSSVVSLCTATFSSDTAKTVFIVVAVIGILLGVYLLFSWWKTRASISKVIKKIRNRIEILQEDENMNKEVNPSDVEPQSDNEPIG